MFDKSLSYCLEMMWRETHRQFGYYMPPDPTGHKRFTDGMTDNGDGSCRRMDHRNNRTNNRWPRSYQLTLSINAEVSSKFPIIKWFASKVFFGLFLSKCVKFHSITVSIQSFSDTIPYLWHVNAIPTGMYTCISCFLWNSCSSGISLALNWSSL